jgi:beta-glucosidase
MSSHPDPALPDTGTAAVDETELARRVAGLTLEQKVRLLTGADFWALHPEPDAGLRRLVTSDGPAGVRGERWDERDTSANIPSPTALAATWDTGRVDRMGRLLAAQARSKGVAVLLAPTINLHRSAFGGRHFECLSEDPLLTARIGAAFVTGVQAGGVAACAKHFVANDSETQRMTLDARVGERALRELYLAPFRALVDAGVWTVMAAYNGVNGHTMTEHPMMRDVLHGEWGFDGAVISDWTATRSVVEAGRSALDLAMPGPTGPWTAGLVEAVRAGQVDQALVDDKVLRILRLAARVGVLDGFAPAVPAADAEAVAAGWTDEAIAAEIRATAAASFVLLRNEVAALPLQRATLRRVALIGPNAATARTLGGGSATVFPPYTVSPLAGLTAAFGDGVQVEHVVGAHPSTRVPLLDSPVVVRFLDADDAELGREVRTRAAFNWLGGFGIGIDPDRVTTVEVSGELVAGAAGRYRVGVSGVGRFRLELDGEPVFDDEVVLAADDDPVVGLMIPPQQLAERDLDAGQRVAVLVRHTVGAGFMPGVVSVSFQLNAEADRGAPELELQRAVDAAAAADVAIVLVGTTEEVESEGFDRTSLALPGDQDELVRRVAAVNPRTVVVVNSGAPVLMPWWQDVSAVLLSWFPGQEFGNALADVLLGVAEPGGRLPTTWPGADAALAPPSTTPIDGVLGYDEDLFIGYRAWQHAGLRPAFPFGYGLGYTSWQLADATMAQAGTAQAGTTQAGAGGFDVRVRVLNTGDRAGRQVVQVYASRPGSAVQRPARWLVGFAAAELASGRSAEVTITVPRSALQHWDVAAHEWQLEPGAFTLQIGTDVEDLPLAAAIEV